MLHTSSSSILVEIQSETIVSTALTIVRKTSRNIHVVTLYYHELHAWEWYARGLLCPISIPFSFIVYSNIFLIALRCKPLIAFTSGHKVTSPYDKAAWIVKLSELFTMNMKRLLSIYGTLQPVEVAFMLVVFP